ncbi:MAG: AAA family ATPase, partial [Candidatus Thorarchaeota archaeon]|nr:AAA family ATPase [Candidatus Thorarchaeota archaeon]
MFLRKMTFNKYKIFSDAELYLPRPTDEKFITIIVGENGSGKTIITQAYQWCLYGDAAEVGPAILTRSSSTNDPSKAIVKIEFDTQPKGMITLERCARFASKEDRIEQVLFNGAFSSLKLSTDFEDNDAEYD